MCRQLQRKRRGCGHSVGEGVSGSAPGQWIPVERWMWTHFQSEPTLFQTLVSGTHLTLGCPPLCKEGTQGDKDRERVCEWGGGRWREEYYVKAEFSVSKMKFHDSALCMQLQCLQVYGFFRIFMEITLHIRKRSKKYGRQECSRRRGKYYDKRAGTG